MQKNEKIKKNLIENLRRKIHAFGLIIGKVKEANLIENHTCFLYRLSKVFKYVEILVPFQTMKT